MEFSGQAIAKTRLVLLIAILNAIMYFSIFLVTVVIVPLTANPPYGSGWLYVSFLAYTGFAYSVAGLVGSLLLLKHLKWIYVLALIGWTIELALFSILGSISYLYSYPITCLPAYLSIVFLKVVSATCFAAKRVRAAFDW